MGDTNTNSYTPPVSQLLTYGEAQIVEPEDWPNYLELGLGPAQIPDLIRMAIDDDLNGADVESLASWAPVHAWRALGQLRAEDAVESLLPLFDTKALNNRDWAIDELPEIIAMIGPAALPAIAAYLADTSHTESSRNMMTDCIERLVVRWPEVRPACVEIVVKQLEHFDEDEYEINAFLIHCLVAMQATEAAPLIERAFAADSVDTMVMGDWGDVQFELGLLPEEELEQRRAERLAEQERMTSFFAGITGTSTGKPSFASPPLPEQITLPQASPKERQQHEASRQKSKSKMAKQSRKKNRKK